MIIYNHTQYIISKKKRSHIYIILQDRQMFKLFYLFFWTS